MKPAQDYYELLGVNASADASSLRKAFHKKSKTFHPDTTSLPEDEAAEYFQLLCEAYELLLDPQKRRDYDRELIRIRSDEAKTYGRVSDNNYSRMTRFVKVSSLRPLSGGELFSLVILGLTLLLSLILCLVVAFMKGKELMFQPSWLVLEVAPPLLVYKVFILGL